MKTIGLIGVGNIGQIHLANLLSLRGCRVAGVCDMDRELLTKVAQQFSVKPYSNVNQLLQESDLDAVLIATPSSTHKQLACDALAAGKHVFIEKPLAETLEDSRAILAATAASELIVQVGFCERFNVAYIEAKRNVVQGRLGSIRSLHTSRVAPLHLGSADWNLGVLDTAVHNFDLILWLTEKSPQSVLAKAVNVYPDQSLNHSCTTLITFEDGSLAADTIAWVREDAHPLAQCAQSQMFIQGDRGALRVDHTSRPAWVMDEDKFCGIDTIILGGLEYYGCLKLQLDHFLAAIDNHQVAPAATVEEALQVEVVALAALESLRTGREISLR